MSKIYTFLTKDNHESKNTKGINKNVAADELKYEDQTFFVQQIIYKARNKQNLMQRS